MFSNIKKITYKSTITGCIIGHIIGIKMGYEDTRNDPILINTMSSISYGVFTGIYGGILGMYWYITIPVMIYRFTYDNIFKNKNNVIWVKFQLVLKENIQNIQTLKIKK
jgi:hypothetical protein